MVGTWVVNGSRTHVLFIHNEMLLPSELLPPFGRHPSEAGVHRVPLLYVKLVEPRRGGNPSVGLLLKLVAQW